MSNTMTGKEVLRAIADGADPSEFEWRNAVGGWSELNSLIWKLKDFLKDKNEFRRKPRTRVVNGFTVPAPIQEMPESGAYIYLPDFAGNHWYRCQTFAGFCPADMNLFSRGLLFSTKEAAIANAKAMVGIDPNGEA